MAAYEYVALDASGRKKKGVVSADSLTAARKEIRRQSLTPLTVDRTSAKTNKVGESVSGNSRSKRLSEHELVLATRQLAMLITSGTPVEQALAAVAAASEASATRSILTTIREEVVEGRSLSEALRTQEKSFPKLYCSIVSAGESAGALGPVMDRLADYLEESERTRRKITSALIYPVVLAVVAFSVVTALMIFVVPRVVEQFDTMGQELPLLTRIVVSISEFLVNYGVFLLIVLFLIGVAFGQAMRTEAVRRFLDRATLKVPIVGKLARSVSAARFSRTFATLANSGAPVLDCLVAARETTPNLVLRDGVDQITEAVREGGSLSNAMSKSAVFPPLAVHMASSGEAGGRLGEMFDKGAEYLESEFDAASAMALGLLEPLITVFMGGMVMVIILAIMLPILQLNTAAML